MSQSANPMKLKINTACDLNSISVLPPHSRRSNAMSQASQIRSQSQQSFSQGMSMSQPSQTSLDENLMNDHRFETQERDKSSNRISSLASGTATRDESQLQLVRTSNSGIRRWGTPAYVPDNRCQVSEELDNRLRQMEGSLNRIGMILDSVQSDVMQVNRAVKEVSLETEGVRQKIFLLDNSMGHMIREEEGLKAFLDAKLKSIPEQILESDRNNLKEISSTLSVLPKKIDSQLAKFQHEVSVFVAEKIEAIANSKMSFNNRYPDSVQLPKSRCCVAVQQYQKNQKPSSVLPPVGQTKRVVASSIEEDVPKALKPKLTGSNRSVKQEEITFQAKAKDFRVIIDSDEDSDAGVSCLLVKKETGKASYLREEANEETLRILRRARKRQRKISNCVILD